MSLHIQTQSSEQARATAIENLRRETDKLLQQKSTALILLSGGGNIEIAKQALLPLIAQNADSFSSQITMMVLDERMSNDPQINNSLLFTEAGLSVTPTIPHSHETVAEFGQRFHQILGHWLEQHPDGKILATLGMGADGHIAGISPFPAEPERFQTLFVDNPQYAVGYQGNLEPAERVTITLSFFQRIQTVLGYISGEEKSEAFTAFVKESTIPAQHPVQLLHTTKAEISLNSDIILNNHD